MARVRRPGARRPAVLLHAMPFNSKSRPKYTCDTWQTWPLAYLPVAQLEGKGQTVTTDTPEIGTESVVRSM